MKTTLDVVKCLIHMTNTVITTDTVSSMHAVLHAEGNKMSFLGESYLHGICRRNLETLQSFLRSS